MGDATGVGAWWSECRVVSGVDRLRPEGVVIAVGVVVVVFFFLVFFSFWSLSSSRVVVFFLFVFFLVIVKAGVAL